jgi:hypothetical protein
VHLTTSGSGTADKDDGVLHLWGVAWERASQGTKLVIRVAMYVLDMMRSLALLNLFFKWNNEKLRSCIVSVTFVRESALNEEF